MTSKPTQTLTVERDFDCTPEEVWAAWTDPKRFAKWINPMPGARTEVHEWEMQKGGRVRFAMVAPDGNAQMEDGTIEAFDRPREIVMYSANEDRSDMFAGYPMRMRVTIEAVGAKTRLRLVNTGMPPDFPLDMGKQGWGTCFDQLADVLAGRR